jgi:hypothetical protein
MAAKTAKPAGAHRALSIGVGRFPGAYAALPYASDLAAAFRTELGAFGYACGDPVATDWTSQTLGEAVREAIRSASADDVLIVHVLTHGEVGDATGKLYVVGSDGTRHDLADVEGWLTAVQDGEHPPLVLFVLDICEAGTAARLPWQGATADGSARAWVIAACGPQEQAFNGWLTQATTTVLRRLREGDLDIDPSVEFVPLPKVAQEIRAEVRRLAKDDGDGLAQQVTGTQLDISVAPPSLPFFTNPAHSSNPLVTMRSREEPALTTFTEGIGEPVAWGAPATGAPPATAGGTPAPLGGPAAWADGLDDLPSSPDLSAGFWADRTRGQGLITAAPDAGCFSGRTAELSELVPWMQGYQLTRNGHARTLYVVTGGPGVGKSAVLGVLVCAAHPKLRKPTQSLWSHASQAPGLIEQLVAVHARQRGLTDVTECLARQLAEILPSPLPEASADPDRLLADLKSAAGHVPVIVLDALDEAVGPQQIVDQLIFPLAAARRPDGSPACRLLVGTRRHGFERLLDTAQAEGGLVDLDQTDRSRLLDDLSGYVGKLLRTQPGYRDRSMARARGAFAEEVASTLARSPDGDRRWGEFLIAGLYTHSFLRGTAAAPVSSADEAGNRGAACPHTLPAVLDLDLATRENARDLRQVLQIVALAKGDGMPASVIDRVRPRRPRFGDYTPTLRALSELGFYLRRANDEDGTTLYRVFHEGLADELRPPEHTTEDPEEILLRASLSAWEPGWSTRSAEQAILVGLLRDLGPAGARRWDLAEPYALRHALDHAHAAFDPDPRAPSPDIQILDPEFLVHADPAVIAALASLDTETERMMDAHAVFQFFLLVNAALLSLGGYVDTVLEGIRALALAAAEPPDAQAPTRSPAAPWGRRAALALAAARLGKRDLAAALANPPAGSPESPLPWQPRWTTGRYLPANRMLYGLWPSGVFQKLYGSGNPASALTVGAVDGQRVVAIGTTNGMVEVRELLGGGVVGEFPLYVFSVAEGRWQLPPPEETDYFIEVIGFSPDPDAVFVVVNGVLQLAWLSLDAAGAQRVPDTRAFEPAGLSTRYAPYQFVALETVSFGGRTLVALTDAKCGVTIADVTDRELLERIAPKDAFTPMTIGGTRYRLFRTSSLPISGPDVPKDSVWVRPFDGRPTGYLSGHTGVITTLTTMTLDGQPVAVTASLDGTVRFWDVPALREIERLNLPGPVQTVAPVGNDHLAVLCCGEVIVYARRDPSRPPEPPAQHTVTVEITQLHRVPRAEHEETTP